MFFHDAETAHFSFAEHKTIAFAQIMKEEWKKYWRTEKRLKQDSFPIWVAMKACVQQGIRNEGILPGGLEWSEVARSLYTGFNQ